MLSMTGFSCRTLTQILIVVQFRPKTMNSGPSLVDSNSNRQIKIKASGVWILLGLFVSVELNLILRIKNHIPFQILIN